MSIDCWTVVKGKRRSRQYPPACHNGRFDHTSHPKLIQEVYSPDEVSCRVDKLHDAFAEIKDKVRQSGMFRRLHSLICTELHPNADVDGTMETATGRAGLTPAWLWDEVKQLIVFGLGSLNSYPAPRYQLALALLVAEILPGVTGAVEAYDPVFDMVDRAFLQRVGVKVLQTNEQGKRVAVSPTLFYLPHCEGGLCSNVLRANAGSLDSIAILGNSFCSYYEQWSWKDEASKQRSHEDWGWGPIVDILEHEGVTETVISDQDFPAVSNSRPFNDMSLHLFSKPLQPRPEWGEPSDA